jgi:tetratricopeptide (TPR) repeat protein
MAKATSWKVIRDQKRKENFVGRGEPIRLFTENFSTETPEFMVFSITGEGGVGKSTLLGRIEHIASADQHNALVVICDDKQTSPVLAMGFISEKLKEKGISHKEFDDRYKKYGELRRELESDPKVPRSVVNVIARGVTDFTIKSLKKTPGAGVFFEYADEKAAGEALAELMQYSILKWGNKDEVKLLREPELTLTPLFLELVKKASDDQPVLLMFDVFERTCDALSPWLFSLFKFEYGEYDTGLSFVISGREPLDQHWTELAGLICHVSLEPFSLEETKLYLNNQEITDDNLVVQVYEDTGGLPVLVELLAATKPQPGMPLPDISKDAIERFLQWTPDEDKRRIAILAAVPRQFNLDILSTVLGKDATDLFNWLSSQSYVRTDSERGWFYHEKVRDLMIRYLKNTSPSELLLAHQKLAEFFALENSKLNLKDDDAYKNDLWGKTEVEHLYHSVMNEVNHRETRLVNAYLHAFRWHWQYSARIAHLTHQIGHETLSKIIEKLSLNMIELFDAYQQDNHDKVIEFLTLFSKQDSLITTAKSGLYSRRGRANYLTEKYDDALHDLTVSVELEPTYAWAFGNRGETFRLMEKYEEAIRDFDQATELNPNYVWAFNNRGLTYQLMKKYEKAIKDFDQAIEINPKYVWSFRNRGLTYQIMEKYEEAIKDFNQAIELDTKSALNFINRGVTYQAMKKYEKAIKDFDQAIELDTKSAWAFGRRGQTYVSMEKYEEAIKDFDQAIELDPKISWFFAGRGLSYQIMEKYEEMIKDYDQAVELDSKNYGYFAIRGLAYRRMEKYEEAIKDFDQAIKLDSKNTKIFEFRGQTYASMEKYEEAIKDFDHAIEFDSKSTWAFSGRGKIYRVMKKYEEAIKDFDQAIGLDSKNASFFYNRGKTYRLMGKYEEAIKDFDQAIELDPRYAWAFGNRGKTYQLMDKYEDAIKDFSKAIELDPKVSWFFSSRGQIYQSMKMYEKAIKDFDQEIEFDPKYAWAFDRRGHTYQLMGKYEEAIKDFSKIIEIDSSDDWSYYQRSLCRFMNNTKNEAKKDLKLAIELSDQKYQKSPNDWRNTFNLALYYMAIANYKMSKQLYVDALKEDIPTDIKSGAIDDLDNFIRLCPRNKHAKAMRRLFE